MATRSREERAQAFEKHFDHPASKKAREEARAGIPDSPMDRLLRQQHRERGEVGERHRREALRQQAEHQKQRGYEVERGAQRRDAEREQERQKLVATQQQEREALDAKHAGARAALRATAK